MINDYKYIHYKETIKDCKKALLDYQISSIPIIGNIYKKIFKIYTDSGFCEYWKFTLNKEFNGNSLYYKFDEPEFIFSDFKPEEKYDEYFWFKPGELEPRIKILKNCISNLNKYFKMEEDAYKIERKKLKTSKDYFNIDDL